MPRPPRCSQRDNSPPGGAAGLTHERRSIIPAPPPTTRARRLHRSAPAGGVRLAASRDVRSNQRPIDRTSLGRSSGEPWYTVHFGGQRHPFLIGRLFFNACRVKKV